MCKTSSFHTNKSICWVLPPSFSEISSDVSPHDTATGDQMKPTVLLSKSQISLGVNIEHNCLYLFMHFGVWDNTLGNSMICKLHSAFKPFGTALHTFIYIYSRTTSRTKRNPTMDIKTPITLFCLCFRVHVCVKHKQLITPSIASALSYRAAITHNFHSWSWFSLVSLVKLRSQNPKTLELPFSVRKNNSKSLHSRCWKRHKI